MKKTFSTKQDFDAFSRARSVMRKFSGYRSAKDLASEFGGVTKSSPLVDSSKVNFTLEDIVKHTKAGVFDPDLVSTPGMARRMGRVPSDKAHEILPGMYVGDDAHVKMITELRDTLTKEVPMSETMDGICDARGVPTSWDTLFSAPGFAMRPLGYPILDNTETIKSSGFKSERHKRIAIELIDLLCCTKWDPKNGYEVSKISSTGIPRDEHDVEYKMDALRKVVKDFPSLMGKVASGSEQDLRLIAREYGVVMAYDINRRNQNDSVKVAEDGSRTVKDRSSPSLGEVLGTERTKLFSGRTIDEIPGFFRNRSRVVYAGNGPVNYFLGCLWQPLRDHYLNEYDFTFKHRSAEDLMVKTRSWNLVGVDASQFDQNYPTWFADQIFDQLEEKTFSKDVCHLMRLMWRAPAFCPSPIHEDPTQWAWFGNPFDLSTFVASRGLPSGIAYNPDFGKIFGTFYILCLLDDVFGDVLEFGISDILKGQHPAYMTLNQGDDALIGFKEPEMRQQLVESLASGEASPYINLDLEDPVTFLGWVVTSNGSAYEIYPNIVSMVVNFFCNEHSIGDPNADRGHRRHWGIGVESWPTVFGVCPEYDKVRSIVDMVCLKHTGKTLTEIAAPFAEQSRKVLSVDSLSEDEARFMDKPERRFYSIDMDNVRSQILGDVIRTVSPSEIYTSCKYLVNNNLL